MPVTCPIGHTSESTDYCDTCGTAILGSAPAATGTGTAAPDPAAAAAPGGTAQIPAVGAPAPCPNCGAPAGPDDAFCEVCGIDFATGELPAQTPPSAAAAPVSAPAPPEGAGQEVAADQWVAVVEPDRAFYEGNQDPDVHLPFPEGAAPREVPLRSDEVLIGRRSDTKGIFPDVDLSASPEDPGVSRRHAVLRRRPDGSWVVIDQGSTNGTRVGSARAPIPPGEERALGEGDHLLVGAWTRITLRRGAASA